MDRRNLFKALWGLSGLGFLKLISGYLGSTPEGKAPEFEEFDLAAKKNEDPICGHQGLAWLLHDQKGFYALLNRCAHLGCPVRFDPLVPSFSCPCHGSAYNKKGEVIKGPAARPLKRLKLVKTSETRLRAELGVEVGAGFRL